MSEIGSLNYIVAFYLGDRMHRGYNIKLQKNKLYFLEKQIEFLNKGTKVDLVSFVFNTDYHDSNSLPAYLSEKFKNYNIKIPFEIIIRPNDGFSYGAWNDVIKKNIGKFDYFFLMEDDYIPVTSNFYIPFHKKMKKDTAFVCVMTSEDPKVQNSKRHASFSCGLIRGKICKFIFSKYKEVFKIIPTNTYSDAYLNQINFYDYFPQEGYKMDNIIDKYCLPYMDSAKNNITLLGDSKNPPIMFPVDFDEYASLTYWGV